ncbi:MAG: DUF4399 domain-containing protein [Gammaproteobacteria bacterium]|nr:DUF4399 domain-containing protein [Gammaproteobacteria bacterium]
MKTLSSILLLSTLSFALLAHAHSPSKSARIFISSPNHGAEMTSPLRVTFSIQGFKVVPTGTKGRERHLGGHHILLVDTPLPDLDEPIPITDQIIHLSKGEREILLTLPPGEHTLQLLLGDEEHESFEPPLYSKPITILIQ